MTNEQIDAVARRVVELLRAEREGWLAEIERAEAATDDLEASLMKLRRLAENG